MIVSNDEKCLQGDSNDTTTGLELAGILGGGRNRE